MATKYSVVQVEKLCTQVGECCDVVYYEHPYGGDEVPVIAVGYIKGELIAFQTTFYDPWESITDTEYVCEEGEEAYHEHTSDLTDEEHLYV